LVGGRNRKGRKNIFLKIVADEKRGREKTLYGRPGKEKAS